MSCKYCVMRYSPAALEKLSKGEAAARPPREKSAAQPLDAKDHEERKDKDTRAAEPAPRAAGGEET